MSSIINLLSQGLDGALSRQKALASNVANVDTPNYKRQDVDFISILKKEREGKSSLPLKNTDSSHVVDNKLERSNLSISSLKNTSYRNDKNNVDIDVEMAEVAKNALYFNTLSRQITDQFSMLKNVISKGGGA